MLVLLLLFLFVFEHVLNVISLWLNNWFYKLDWLFLKKIILFYFLCWFFLIFNILVVVYVLIYIFVIFFQLFLFFFLQISCYFFYNLLYLFFLFDFSLLSLHGSFPIWWTVIPFWGAITHKNIMLTISNFLCCCCQNFIWLTYPLKIFWNYWIYYGLKFFLSFVFFIFQFSLYSIHKAFKFKDIILILGYMNRRIEIICVCFISG